MCGVFNVTAVLSHVYSKIYDIQDNGFDEENWIFGEYDFIYFNDILAITLIARNETT